MRSAYRLWFCSVTAEWLVMRGSTTLYCAPFYLDAYSAMRAPRKRLDRYHPIAQPLYARWAQS